MSVPSINNYRLCIEHFEGVRHKYYRLRREKESNNNNYQIAASINYFNSRIRYYKGKIRQLQRKEWVSR